MTDGENGIWNDIIWLHHSRRGRTRSRSADEPRHGIILAGASGPRLSQLTRELTGSPLPKQFCTLKGDAETLLQRAVERTRQVVRAGTTRVVVARTHSLYVEHQLGSSPKVTLVAQPDDRGTGMGALLALIELAIQQPDAQVVVMPADHAFHREDVVIDTIRAAFADSNRDPDRVTVVAAHAIEDDEGHQGGEAENTLIVVATVRALLMSFQRHLPSLVRMFAYHASLPAGEADVFLERAYASIRSVDLMVDVLDRDDCVWVRSLPREAGWNDLATEERLRAWIGPPAREARAAAGGGLLFAHDDEHAPGSR